MKKIFSILAAFFFFSLVVAPEDAEKSEREKREETIKFGVSKEVISLLDELTKEKDDEFCEIFKSELEGAKNANVKEKILRYFIACEKDESPQFVVAAIENSADESPAVVSAAMRYAAKFKISVAIPALKEMAAEEDGNFVAEAIAAIGEIGSTDEAEFLRKTFADGYPSSASEYAVVEAYGNLGDAGSYDELLEIAQDEGKGAGLRCRAIASIGKLQLEKSIGELEKFYESSDARIRGAVLDALLNFDAEGGGNEIAVAALKDDDAAVREKAAIACAKKNLQEAVPALIYRAKNDSESDVKYKCYEALSILGGDECIEFLEDVLRDKKAADKSRAKAAQLLLKNCFERGISAVISSARETLADDKRKALRNLLGNELKKYENPALAEICLDFLQSADAMTAGCGLDIYEKNRFPQAEAAVRAISERKNAGGLAKKAKRILEKN